MNIEEAIKYLQNNLNEWKEKRPAYGNSEIVEEVDNDYNAIESLLTAYEKEKGENVKLRLQDIPLIEGELKAYKDRVNELKIELEKEKEKNKELEEKIIHRYKRICPECNNSFIAKRNNTKYCQKCSKPFNWNEVVCLCNKKFMKAEED